MFMFILLCLTALTSVSIAHIPCQRAGHVLVIGVDGLGSAYYNWNSDEWKMRAPNLHHLFAGGIRNMDARATLPSLSLPNWSSFLLGTRNFKTGINTNIPPSRSRVIAECTTLFGAAKQSNLSTALFTSWKPLLDMSDSSNIDTFEYEADDYKLVRDFRTMVRSSHPELAFVHIGGVDHAGHKFGWGSSEYKSALASVDNLVATILSAYDSVGIKPVTFVIADHGGTPMGEHGGNTRRQRRVPLVVNGPNVYANKISRALDDLAVMASTVLHTLAIPRPKHWSAPSAARFVFTCDAGDAPVDEFSKKRCANVQQIPQFTV